MGDDGAVASGDARRLPAGRKAELASFIDEVGEVTVAKLAEKFRVSADTIRRDLDQLDADGLVVRTHGGAVSAATHARPDSELDHRLGVQAQAKDVIGALAADLVVDNTAIMINSGTTSLALVRHLKGHRQLTVATNNLRLPLEISPDIYRDLHMFGGSVRRISSATVGPIAFRSADGLTDLDIRCDIAFIGVGAVSSRHGFSTSNLSEATMMAGMMDRSERVAILADSSKFGHALFAKICDFSRVNYLVSDLAPPSDIAAACAEAGVEIILPRS